MNIRLGARYKSILRRLITREHAKNQTQAIQKALVAYEQKLEEEEMRLVHLAVESEMKKIRSGEVKTISYEEVKNELGL